MLYSCTHMATVGVKGLKLIVKLNERSIIHSYCKVHTCNVLMKWCLQCQLCFSCFIKLMHFWHLYVHPDIDDNNWYARVSWTAQSAQIPCNLTCKGAVEWHYDWIEDFRFDSDCISQNSWQSIISGHICESWRWLTDKDWTKMVNGKWLPDFIERLKASAW